jgi:uncharacterized protein
LELLARPVKWRRVEFIPDVQYFAPFGTDKNSMEENILLVEELEAIRLKDLEGMEQEECAEKMEVSRQTFQRILNTARAKVADSLINGKAVKIAGGNYTRNICPVRCLDCGKQWNESYESFGKILNGEYNCPVCNSNKIACLHNDNRNFCRRNCHRHGRGGRI